MDLSPHTRHQIDSVLGWMGYSLSYTEQDPRTFTNGPATDVRTPRYTAQRNPTEASLRVAGSATVRPDASIVLRHMLEAFAEGLLVCGRLLGQLVMATYRYASRRLEEFRDPEFASQNRSSGHTRPTLRMRMDDGLERVLDALEARVRAVDPMPALRRARTAFAAKTAEADVRIARIWWPDKAAAEEEEEERKEKDMDVTAPESVASREPAQVAQTHPVRSVPLPEPVARYSTETRGNVFDAPPVEVLRPRDSDATPVTVEARGLSETFIPSVASPPSSDPTDPAIESVSDAVIEPVSDADRDDRPWYLRWSSLLSFLGRKDTGVPSLFDDSRHLDATSADRAPGQLTPAEPEGVDTLARLERMLDSSSDTPPTEDEIEALSRRRPRVL